MKCPNCGALSENGKNKCFLCGMTFNEENTNSTPNNTFFQPDADGFSTGMKNKNTFPQPPTNHYPEYQEDKKVYVHKDKKDIFDFYSEHKKGIKIILLLITLALISIIGYKVYDSHKNPKITPILMNLYYDIDNQFTTTKNTNTEKAYAISSSKGNDCSIAVATGTTTSGDHVKEYYTAIEKALEPTKDKEGNIIDEMELYQSNDNEQIINSTTWFYRSIYYKENINSINYTELKYRYYTSVYKGYYYDIVLVNNNNSSTCSLALDNFVNSLKFIE